MAIFENALKTIKNGLNDLGTLEVVTFSGRVELTGNSQTPVKFDEVMNEARAATDIKVKVLASTKAQLDGDIVAFYDQDIQQDEKLAHSELVEAGAKTRQATVDFVTDILGDAVKAL